MTENTKKDGYQVWLAEQHRAGRAFKNRKEALALYFAEARGEAPGQAPNRIDGGFTQYPGHECDCSLCAIYEADLMECRTMLDRVWCVYGGASDKHLLSDIRALLAKLEAK